MPERIQRKRTKGWKKPEGAVYVGRGSRYGNPFKIGAGHRTRGMLDSPSPIDGPYLPGVYATRDVMGNEVTYEAKPVADAAEAIDLFKRHYSDNWKWLFPNLARDLRGRDLMCWCPIDQPCHADVLLEIANGGHRG
jgi:hypothetical protein